MRNSAVQPRKGRSIGRTLNLGNQLLIQLFCVVVAISVLLPILWIVSMSLEGSDFVRPSKLSFLPSSVGAPNFDAYRAVIDQPTASSSSSGSVKITFWTLFNNSLGLSLGVSFFSVLIGVSAAYAFSRFNFSGRKLLFLGIGFILLMPGVATLAPLFAMLSKIQLATSTLRTIYYVVGGVLLAIALALTAIRVRDNELTLLNLILPLIIGSVGVLAIRAGMGVVIDPNPKSRNNTFVLRQTLYGVGFAMISGALPFAIWNLKGYLDTIPKELEEAAIIDGATPNQIFFRIVLPLAVPALAVTAFLGFMAGWTEFALSQQFLNEQQNYTLAVALNTMTGQHSSVPWSKFAAMSMLISLPVSVVYLMLQKYIVGGLTLGGVKG